jgi:peptidoglycan biosynthesis protein MviN/MurJ (putative lipid II flippase)
LGESYIGIHALADLFLFAFKISNKLSGTVAEEW